MLRTLRNSSKNIVLKFILGTLLTILIISFAMWGTEDLIGVTKKQSTVASVGKLDVSAKEFFSLYSRQTEEIRKLLGASLDIKKSREFGYVDRALSSLINRALFNNEALELGLSVSDRNVRDKILADDAFKDDLGQFSELLFRQLISESGYTEVSYVEGTRQDLAREQMVETIRSSLIIPNIIKNSLGEYNLQQRSVDYIVIDSNNEKISKISNEDLFKYYEENKTNFLSDELRSSETLLLDANKYAKKLTVTEDEIKLLYEERKESLIEPERRYLKQILVQDKDKAYSIHEELKKKISFPNVAKSMANLTEDDIDLGWNTRSELPEEIVDSVFKLKKNQFTVPVKSSFGWHILKLIDLEKRKEITFNEIKNDFKNEILLDKGKEAVYDLQDELEDLIASGNTFDEISKTLDVELIKSNKINRNGNKSDSKDNNGLQDERILRTIFNQKLNEEGNIINTDKDEGLAISIVTEIIEPKQLSYQESLDQVTLEITNKLQKKQAKEKAEKIKNKINSVKDFSKIAKDYKLEVRGVKPFTRILSDDSELPIPLISKIFESKLFEVNIEERGPNEIIIAQTVEIIDDLAKDNKELNEFSKRIKDDITIDLLAQFSEALRKKYKITINDDVIDQLN
jgi:peptidyl-prolyl cis-trans isomerase D